MSASTDPDFAPDPKSATSSLDLPRIIVVGVDGSSASAYATRWVATLAATLGARVVLIHAASAVNELLNDSLLGSPNWRRETRRRIDQEWAQPLRELGVEYRTRLVEKPPGAAILSAAKEEHAGLIAVGIHRQRKVHSLSAYLSHHAGCPVVTIPLAGPAGPMDG